MKRITLFLFVLFATTQIQAQLTNGTYTQEIDERIKNLDKTPITSNILIDRVFQVAQTPVFNQETRKETSNVAHFKQAWSELNRASYTQNTFPFIPNLSEKTQNLRFSDS